MFVAVVALQVCAALPAGGVAISRSTVCETSIAASPAGVAVVACGSPAGAARARPPTPTWVQLLDRATLAPRSVTPIRVRLRDRWDSYEGAAVTAVNGGIVAAFGTYRAGAGRQSITVLPVAGSTEHRQFDFGTGTLERFTLGTSGRGVAIALTGSDTGVITPTSSFDAPTVPGPGELPTLRALNGHVIDRAPALARADGDRLALAGLASGEGSATSVEVIMVSAAGEAASRSVSLSPAEHFASAPAVTWSAGVAHVVFAEADSDGAPARLMLARWTPNAVPARLVLAESVASEAPSIVASARAGCFVVSWTRLSGSRTEAMFGRLCGDALDAASVARLSRAGFDGGHTALTVDGSDAFVTWQERTASRSGAPSQGWVRVARVECR